MKKAVCFLFACSIFFPSASRASDTNEPMTTVVYPITFGELDAVEAIGRSIVENEGHVVMDRSRERLIVATTTSRHARLKEVLGQAVPDNRNVRIDVHFVRLSHEENRSFAVHGEGTVVVDDNGSESVIHVQPRVQNTLSKGRSADHQMLVVANGREVSLRVGEQIPYLEWISEYTWSHGFTQTRLAWQEAGSFLLVSPTILPDGKTIRVRLIPEIRGELDGKPCHMSFAALATEVIVASGASLSIAANTRNTEFYSRFLVGFSRQGGRESVDISLTPSIVEFTETTGESP